MIDNNAVTTVGLPKWVPYAGLTGLGIVPLLVGAGLLLGPVAHATASTRAYDAATPCAQEQARDCLSEAPATVARIPEEGSVSHADIEVRTADGAVRRIHLAHGVYTAPVPAGAPVRLVSWQGGIRDVAYGGAGTGRAADSVMTGANPHVAHQQPLGAALFLIPFGVGALSLAAWLAWFSSRSRRTAPGWTAAPFVGLALVGVFGGAAGEMSASAAEALRPTALVGGLTLLAATVFCLVQVVRETRSR
ncbi:hypothetical protein [Streptomyces xanthophaeus]|uniref:hypothetical protein n=1 Tax=Streptomyces xanthophaeus TaxID=67385 RepID=UPI0026495E85|nr:hypothetical protein [Streptomyces xanthophaeus]WKD33254.1 hypothetical protein KO717_15635 [Streptomyces xanthophaeus]